ncbi:MAG: glycosyltransferase family 39 protein [bacterium]
MTSPYDSLRRRAAALGLVLLLALAIRVVYLLIYSGMPDWHQLTVDNYFHLHWAERIAEGDLLGDTTYFRAPFYIWYLAGLISVFGVDLWALRVIGMLLGLASVATTYFIARRIFNHRTGLTAAIIQSFYPAVLYFEGEILLDSLFTLLMQLSVLAWLRLIAKPGGRAALGCGLLFGLASITRPTALPVIAVLAVVLILLRYRQVDYLRTTLAPVVLGLVILVAPISIRNLVVVGDAVLIASQGGVNFFIGNHQGADGIAACLPEPLGHNWRIADVTHVAEKESGRQLKPGEVSDFWLDRAADWIVTEPTSAAVLYLKKLYHTVSNDEVSNNRHLGQFFSQVWILGMIPISFAVVFAFAMVGMIWTWRQSPGTRWLTLLIAVNTALIAAFFFSSRFRLPVLPFWIVLAAGGANVLAGRIVSRHRSTWMIAAVVILGWLFSAAPLVPLPAGSSSMGLISKGLFYYNTGDYEQAIRFFRGAREVRPDFAETNLNLAACYLRSGQTDSASFYLEEELRLHPDRHRTYINLASMALLSGNPNEALTLARQAVQRVPYDRLANQVLLRAAASADLSNAAMAGLIDSALANTDNDLYLLNEAAVILSERGDRPRARQLLRKAIVAQRPPIETDDAAFETEFRHSTAAWRTELAKAHHQLGYLLGLDGEFARAALLSETAIAYDSTLVGAWINLVSALAQQGSLYQADSLVQVIKLRFPNDPLVRRLGSGPK